MTIERLNFLVGISESEVTHKHEIMKVLLIKINRDIEEEKSMAYKKGYSDGMHMREPMYEKG